MIERYSRAPMRALWSDQARYDTWLEVELAACRAMERLGRVPKGTADQVQAKVRLDAAQILQIEERVRHDVIAFLTHVEQQAGEPARWLHLGLTSSDILDSAFALQLGRAGALLLTAIDGLLEALARRADETRHLPMVGRSHGIHAEPTAVGLVFAGAYAELGRQRRRLVAALEEVAVGKLAGAVGVYGNVSPEVEAGALAALGLRPETCATQVVARDRHAALFAALGQLASSLERLAQQVRHWQRTEVGEAFEPFGRGQKGSSAMPHKRNPILTENVCGLARLVRGAVVPALENVALWHERDISHSSVERVIAPDVTTLVDFMLYRMTQVIAGLELDEARLAANLALTGGLIFSEAVLLALIGKGLARQRAYELVQRCAMAAQSGAGDFRALLGADAEILAVLSSVELDGCFDVQHHLRFVDVIYERVFRAAAASGAAAPEGRKPDDQ
ncbi:MAG: adenylosuccinate lyase [Proteobacteria bacterium]|nr:adenylosuccinate lyase [Pseudomonadota bacterium]